MLFILPLRFYNLFKRPLTQRADRSDLVWQVTSRSYVDTYENFGGLYSLCLLN